MAWPLGSSQCLSSTLALYHPMTRLPAVYCGGINAGEHPYETLKCLHHPCVNLIEFDLPRISVIASGMSTSCSIMIILSSLPNLWTTDRRLRMLSRPRDQYWNEAPQCLWMCLDVGLF
ncbi:hypothetical protein P692DRAFT_20339840 [Suillus brevipes Sb2]|nr:hypothetical protein P692DRAFT_20339840 [Suillus brevipes Sb2]